MSTAWKEIKGILELKGCLDSMQLKEGVSHEEIIQLESHIGVELPTSLKAFLMEHNGQDHAPGLVYGYQLLSVGGIRDQWDVWRSLDEADMNADSAQFMSSSPDGFIKPLYTNPKWIPLTYDYGGNHFGIDYDPDRKGVSGQIITFGRDEDEKKLKANSFDEFISLFIEHLRSARWNNEYLEWDS